MKDISLNFLDGPMAGQTVHCELGAVAIGREPRPQPGQTALRLLGADGSVSRSHALISDESGQVILENTSGNGTRVDGALIQETIALNPGSKVSIGDKHAFIVDWIQVGEATLSGTPQKPKATKQVASSGPLASPVVRAVLAVYLLGIVGVAVWLTYDGVGDEVIGDDWPRLEAQYKAYEQPGVSEAERAARTARAEALLIRLRVLSANNQTESVRRLCRELMSIDADIQSPLYRYGARCLGRSR